MTYIITKKILIQFLLLQSVFLLSCEGVDTKLLVKNESEKTIVLAYGVPPENNSLSETPVYPTDSAGNIKMTVKNYLLDSSTVILPHTSKNMHVFGHWENIFTNNNKTSFYILDLSVVLNNTWQEIRSKKMILKTIKYSEEEIKRDNWVIVYKD